MVYFALAGAVVITVFLARSLPRRVFLSVYLVSALSFAALLFVILFIVVPNDPAGLRSLTPRTIASFVVMYVAIVCGISGVWLSGHGLLTRLKEHCYDSEVQNNDENSEVSV